MSCIAVGKCVVLVGGTGFLGSHFIRLFIDSFDKIVVMGLRSNTRMISDVLSKHRERLEVVSGDASELADLIGVFRLCDPAPSCVYMLTAILPREGERSPSRAFKVNLYGLHNVLEASRIVGARNIVFTSSIAVYKPGKTIVSEEDPVDPNTIYGATKAMGEIWGITYARKYGMSFKVLRLPTIIGPGRADGGLAVYTSLAIQKAAQGEAYTIPVSPSTRLPIIYVKDAARALKEVAERDTRHEVYNVAGVDPTPSAEEIVRVVKELIPDAAIDFNPNKSYDQVLSAWPEQLNDSRARNEWGWKPLYRDLRALVRDFIAEVRSLPDIYKV